MPGVASPARSAAYAVVDVNDAVPEAALIEKLESRADVVRQGSLAASYHDREQEHMARVDQPGADRLAGEAPPTAMSALEDSLSRRAASRSNSRSIRVLALDAV